MVHLMDQIHEITKIECVFYYFYIKHLPFAGKPILNEVKKTAEKKVFNKTQLTPQSNANHFFYAQMLNDEYNPDNFAVRNFYG